MANLQARAAVSKGPTTSRPSFFHGLSESRTGCRGAGWVQAVLSLDLHMKLCTIVLVNQSLAISSGQAGVPLYEWCLGNSRVHFRSTRHFAQRGPQGVSIRKGKSFQDNINVLLVREDASCSDGVTKKALRGLSEVAFVVIEHHCSFFQFLEDCVEVLFLFNRGGAIYNDVIQIWHLGGLWECLPSFSVRQRGQMQVYTELYKSPPCEKCCETSVIFMERQLVVCISKIYRREHFCTLKVR